MSGKELNFGTEGRALMLRGVDQLADAVSVTFAGKPARRPLTTAAPVTSSPRATGGTQHGQMFCIIDTRGCGRQHKIGRFRKTGLAGAVLPRLVALSGWLVRF